MAIARLMSEVVTRFAFKVLPPFTSLAGVIPAHRRQLARALAGFAGDKFNKVGTEDANSFLPTEPVLNRSLCVGQSNPDCLLSICAPRNPAVLLHPGVITIR
jgi:hypothetical protein